MVKRINRKDLLTNEPPSGSMLYDKEFPDDIKKKYQENNLNESQEKPKKRKQSFPQQRKVIK